MAGSLASLSWALRRMCGAAVVSCPLLIAAGSAPAQDQAAATAPGQAVPVSVAKAERRDVPIYLTGLGTVQPLNSVLVRSRVDGTLMKVPVSEGQTVKAGEVVAVIDPRPFQAVLDQAMAKRQQDEAMLANAKRDLTRTSALARQDFASRQQLETQQATVAQLTAAIAGDTAAVEAAQLNLSYCYITAPFTGRVGLRQVDPGNLVHANDPGGILTLTQMQPIAATFTLPQEDLPRVAQAMRERTLPVDALGPQGTPLAEGSLLTLDNAIDPASGTIKLKAVFPNGDERLWPGQFVTARLLANTERGALTIPSEAVQHGPSGLFVYVVGADQRVRRQSVTLGADDGHTAVIAKGLEDGATVVTSGQSRLDDGVRVNAKPDETAAAGHLNRA